MLIIRTRRAVDKKMKSFRGQKKKPSASVCQRYWVSHSHLMRHSELPVSFMKNKKELITLRYDLVEYRFEKDTAVINHTHKLEPNPGA
eukprot:scaffold16468_cov68-Skeletonema_dohrnii-CCMP3373.AAC.2